MKLVVGFITYNQASAPYLPYFWPSLLRALSFLDQNDFRILIADNSEEKENPNQTFFSLQSGFESLKQSGNIGFARAYNELIGRALELAADYFLVINPDTILEPDAIERLVEALDRQPTIAMLSPRLLCWDFTKKSKTELVDSLGIGLKPGLRFVDIGQGADLIEAKEVLAKSKLLGPSGAAGLFRLSALAAIKGEHGYFDNRFFMYKEDCDLAYRLTLGGYQAQVVLESIIYHDRSVRAVSSSWKGKIRGRRQKSRLARTWSFNNQLLIWQKHYRSLNLQNKLLVIFYYFSSLLYAALFERFLFNNSKKDKKQKS